MFQRCWRIDNNSGIFPHFQPFPYISQIIRRDNTPGTCFHCHREVLEFPGEWAFFDPYLLFNSGEDDEHVIDADAIGFAHASCLKSTKWGEWWRKRWQWTFPNLWGQPLVWQDDQYHLYLNRNTEEYALISEIGIRVNLQRKHLKGKRHWKEGFLVDREMKFYHQISDPKVVQELLRQIESGKEITLLDFAAAMGLEDTLLDRDQLAQGQFESKRGLKRFLQGKVNDMSIVCPIYLPKEAYFCIVGNG